MKAVKDSMIKLLEIYTFFTIFQYKKPTQKPKLQFLEIIRDLEIVDLHQLQA